MKATLLAIGILFSPLLFAQIDHWESVIIPGMESKYIVPTSEPDADWKALSFDDASWLLGNSGFGYGDNDDETILSPTLSVYIRHTFTIVDLTAIDALLLHMDYDDGFVAYLNGEEIARSFMSGNPPAFDQVTDGLHEALLYQGITPEQFNVSHELLIEGQNILAIQVHNQDINSSDLSALPVLSVGINDNTNNYHPLPEWFQSPLDFVSSNLPIVIINTEGGQDIPDDPKIFADMKIVYRGAGQRTFLSDENDEQYLDFNSKIKIEIRGSTSALLPKKQYGFTTYNTSGTDKENVELLGLPKENDWIINGLAYDPSLMRDFISYNLSRRIGEYASRTQYCEVMLNGKYQGLYVLQEKMKKDDNRINITAVGDNEDGNITGGYITKSDKIDDSDPLAWSMPNNTGGFTNFIHVEPKPEETTIEQNDYIKSEFEKLQNASSNSSLINGYPSVIDIPSFINFMLINELASNVDGYEFSTYFHKDKNGKLRAGPVWDFNLTFGNDLFIWGFDRSHTDIWQFDNNDNVGATFWKDLFDDTKFKCHLSKRWKEITAAGQPLHRDSILTFIDTTAELIAEAKVREQQTWGTVAEHEANTANMKIWISARMEWLTQELGSSASCENIETPPLVISKIDYHPNSQEFGDNNDQEFIEITNAGNTEVDLTGIYFGSTGFVYQFPANSKLVSGGSLILANDIVTFRELYNKTPFGEFTRNLSNSSERLLLLDAFGNVIDDVTYNDDEPWPVLADGEGYFLQLNDFALDNSDPANWIAIPYQEEVLIVGLEDKLNNRITLYPNPSSSVFEINSEEQIIEIRMLNMQSQLLMTNKVSEHNFSMDIGKYKNGIYYLKIKTINGLETYRILKN